MTLAGNLNMRLSELYRASQLLEDDKSVLAYKRIKETIDLLSKDRDEASAIEREQSKAKK